MSNTILLHYVWNVNAILSNSGTTDFFDQYTYLKQLHGFKDAYFWYRGFKIYVSSLPYDFFNNPWTYFSTGPYAGVTTFRFTNNNYYKSYQFYLSNTENLPNADVYYLPLNWFTSDLTYSDNAGLTRGANNGFYRIFSIGFMVISYCKGLNAPDIYSNPFTPQVYDITGTPIALPLKTAPNGYAISLTNPNANNFQIVEVGNNSVQPVMRSLFIYMVPNATPLTNMYFECKGQNSNYSNNSVYAGPGSNFGASIQQSSYYLLDTLYTTNRTGSGGAARQYSNLGLNTTTYGGSGIANVDCIFCATKPIMGNNSLVCFDAGAGNRKYDGFQPVNWEQLIYGFVNSTGQVEPSTSGPYWLFPVTLDVSNATVTISVRDELGGNIPTNYYQWTLVGSPAEIQTFNPTLLTFTNDTSVSVGQFVLVWTSYPDTSQFEWFFINPPNTVITHSAYGNFPLNNYAENFTPLYPSLPQLNYVSHRQGIDYNDAKTIAIADTHSFDTINWDTRGTYAINNSSTHPTATSFNLAVNSLLGSSNLNTIVDDAPLSMAIKILAAGFQTRKYYQFRHLIKGMIVFTQLSWTPTTDQFGNGNTFQSQVIQLQSQLFEGVQEIGGEITPNTNVPPNGGGGDLTTQYSAVYFDFLATNIQTQYIPSAITNDTQIFLNFQKRTQLNSFTIIITNYGSQAPTSQTNVIMYFK